MAREYPTYRFHLEEATRRFPQKDELTVSEVAVLKDRCDRVVRDMFSFNGGSISIVAYAHHMAMKDAGAEPRYIKRRKKGVRS